MIYLFSLAILAFVLGVRRRESASAETWLNRKTTTAINGFFILLVLIGHANQYIAEAGYAYSGFANQLYRWIAGNGLGQLVVAMFLFNSGFGVMESIKAKGDEYVHKMPRHRILSVLLNFDLAVLAFVLLNTLLGIDMSLRQIVLSFLAWDDVGNSNWYIFAILFCYVVSFIGYSLARSRRQGFLIVTVSILGYALVMSGLKGSYWYNTIFAFPAGMGISYFKEPCYSLVRRHWGALFMGTLVVFMIGKLCCGRLAVRSLDHNCVTVVFTFLFALLTVKFDFGNWLVLWCGKNLFPIYIFQRIPMIGLSVFAGSERVVQYPVLFVVLSAILTVPFVLLYKRIKKFVAW